MGGESPVRSFTLIRFYRLHNSKFLFTIIFIWHRAVLLLGLDFRKLVGEFIDKLRIRAKQCFDSLFELRLFVSISLARPHA